jgi:hypothetical protein
MLYYWLQQETQVTDIVFTLNASTSILRMGENRQVCFVIIDLLKCFRILARARDFSFLQNFQTGPGAPPRIRFNGCRGLFSGVKRPEGDSDRSSPSSAEVKNEWSYTYIPPCDLLTSEGRPYVLWKRVGCKTFQSYRTFQYSSSFPGVHKCF